MKNTSLPRSPFSTPLSGSAREAEERIRNIFNTKRNARRSVSGPGLRTGSAVRGAGVLSAPRGRKRLRHKRGYGPHRRAGHRHGHPVL